MREAGQSGQVRKGDLSRADQRGATGSGGGPRTEARRGPVLRSRRPGGGALEGGLQGRADGPLRAPLYEG